MLDAAVARSFGDMGVTVSGEGEEISAPLLGRRSLERRAWRGGRMSNV